VRDETRKMQMPKLELEPVHVLERQLDSQAASTCPSDLPSWRLMSLVRGIRPPLWTRDTVSATDSDVSLHASWE
jgi:hypothetical protein